MDSSVTSLMHPADIPLKFYCVTCSSFSLSSQWITIKVVVNYALVELLLTALIYSLLNIIDPLTYYTAQRKHDGSHKRTPYRKR